MKKPIKPNKPAKPNAPVEPKKTFINNKTEHYISEFDLDKSLYDIINEMNCCDLNLIDLKDFTFRTESDYDCYEDRAYLVYNKPVEVENYNYKQNVIAYKKALKSYDKKLEKYQEKLALYEEKKLKYEEDLKLYNEEILKIEYEQYTKLKAKFESK